MSVLLPTRSLVIAPRLPAKPKQHTGDPFTTLGDIVVDCDVPGCGWHALGARADTKKAWQVHYRQRHGAAQEVGIVLLNHPRQ